MSRRPNCRSLRRRRAAAISAESSNWSGRRPRPPTRCTKPRTAASSTATSSPATSWSARTGAQATLVDLGLAQLADEADGKLTRTRQFVGTLRHASPEQVLSVDRLDRRSDIYSFGATLWELLTLRPLFNATDATPTAELMKRIPIEDPERPRVHNPAVPQDLEAIALKCLEKDPRERYATARDFAEDLARWQRGEPVKARTLTPVYRMQKWLRNHGRTTAMIAIPVLLIAGLTTAVILQMVHNREVVKADPSATEP